MADETNGRTPEHREPAYQSEAEAPRPSGYPERMVGADRGKLEPARGPGHMWIDPSRCEVCDWPFGDLSCRPGDCSYRPGGDAVEARRLAERRAALEERRRLVEDDMRRAGVVSHEEASAIARRYNTSHWHPRGSRAPDGLERARYSIPADPRRDDDIRIDAYIARAARVERAAKKLEEAAGDLVRCIDENPNEECPFCELVKHEDGAEHDAECPTVRVLEAARRLREEG